MNLPTIPHYVALVVTNPHRLQHGSTPRHHFDRTGGTIGSRGANWILLDRNDAIDPIHCEIFVMDGRFCVVDRCGKTRINDGEIPIGRHVGVLLNEGDVLHVGPYQIAVHFEASGDASRHLAQNSIDELIGGDSRQDSLADISPGMRPDDLAANGYALASGTRPDDASLDALDPLAALEVAESRKHDAAFAPIDPTHYGMASTPPPPDLAATRFEAVSGSPTPFFGDIHMALQHADSTQVRDWIAAQQSNHGTVHQLLGPLLSGLGTPLGTLDERAAYQLLLEAGQSLNATIRGITALYGSEQDQAKRPALLGRALQPIEDNPLRLGLDYDATIRALFSNERSMVHLSPMAAIDEGLSEARRHNAALIEAINSSLQALLRAFSPELLLQRFRRYCPEDAQNPAADDWAWQMYTHYYDELASPRQKGFERLFWELFEQAYDQSLRSSAA